MTVGVSMRAGLSLDAVLDALPQATLPIVESVLVEARRSGVSIYLVGGPVRDLLLGRAISDVDLLVVPTGDVGVEALARAAAPDGGRVEVHDRFGTATISTAEASVDLAGVRREAYRAPGALPQVEPGTLLEDLHRRDFSVNALALKLRRTRAGGALPLLDPEEGLADLEARRLRILHDRSFHDDPTRALRAGRLAARLGFGLARSTRSALRDALRDGVFGAVSGDRLRREFEKLFADASRDLDPARALRQLAEWHVLPALEPGLSLPQEAVAPVRRLGRSLASPPWRGPRVRPWVAGLAVWLSPLPRPLRSRVLQRLSVRGELPRRIVAFPSATLSLLEPLMAARGRGAVDALLAGIDEDGLYALHAWAPTAARRRIVRWAAEDRARRLPVRGSDVTELGLSGPAVGRVLARIRASYLDGALANREEALALARELARESSLSRKRAPRKRASRARSPAATKRGSR